MLQRIIHYQNTNSVEATWVDAEGTTVKCHSYADSQMDMLEADLGEEAASHAELIALVRASMVPYIPPPIVVPTSVTMRQARLALLSSGKLGSVATVIASLPSPQKEAAEIEWEYSQEVQRNNGFVSLLAPALGLTETDLDDLFITASGM